MSKIDARDQGDRPTCIAFALADLQCSGLQDENLLSPEFLYQVAASRMPSWQPHSGITVSQAMRSASEGLPEEVDFPYQPVEPLVPIQIAPLDVATYGRALRRLRGDSEDVLRSLNRGRATALCLKLTDTFFKPVAGEILMDDDALPDLLHAVLAVGMGMRGDERYIRIRNSWGIAWGDSGHAWLPVEYLDRHALCSLELVDG